MFKLLCLTFLFVPIVKNDQALSMPLHASCKIEWDWSETSCPVIESAVAKQIGKWNNTLCADDEKCGYALEKDTPSQLTATHTTPKTFYVDDLTFNLAPRGSGGCHVQAKSTSETWYAVLDYGTNYCNLENLITGAGLDKRPGYTEKTSNSVCTQYTSANCKVY